MLDYCTYELAVLAQQKKYHPGFPSIYYAHQTKAPVEPTRGGLLRDEILSAGTLYQLAQWLRNAHNLHVIARPGNNKNQWEFDVGSVVLSDESNIDYEPDDLFDSYEQALDQGLQAALKFV